MFFAYIFQISNLIDIQLEYNITHHDLLRLQHDILTLPKIFWLWLCWHHYLLIQINLGTFSIYRIIVLWFTLIHVTHFVTLPKLILQCFHFQPTNMCLIKRLTIYLKSLWFLAIHVCVVLVILKLNYLKMNENINIFKIAFIFNDMVLIVEHAVP